ncbi:MAG: M56 family metallopeptidase [Dysgonamonadaceae bacterium]|jgi:TonB family protein|nr:M56 family metallopeptidase [Dysgonamonadaceae bacterium]
MEFFIYLLKMNVALVLFYGFYRLFFQQDTLFQWKRAVLLATLAVSALYPFADITWHLVGGWQLPQTINNNPISSYFLHEVIVSVQQTTFPSFGEFRLIPVLFAVYSAIAVFFFMRIIFQIGAICYQISRTQTVELSGQKIYHYPGLERPFSFFRWIVIDIHLYSKTELQEILLHEQTHVRQNHSVDTILTEILCAVCWFNPFAWLLKKEIRMNLEFLADRSVLTSGCEAEHYQLSLLRLSYQKAAAKLSNNFNVSLLKKRIFMMNKKQTSNRSMLKYALIVPLIAALVFFNSALKMQAETVNDPVVQNTSGKQTKKQADKVEAEEKIWDHVEVDPQFPGGAEALMKWLGENVTYPAEVAQEGIQGRVIVKFVVDATGTVKDAKIIQSIHPLLDEEALRAVNTLMPKWIPGKSKGKAVSVYFQLPISFRLSKDSEKK